MFDMGLPAPSGVIIRLVDFLKVRQVDGSSYPREELIEDVRNYEWPWPEEVVHAGIDLLIATEIAFEKDGITLANGAPGNDSDYVAKISAAFNRLAMLAPPHPATKPRRVGLSKNFQITNNMAMVFNCLRRHRPGISMANLHSQVADRMSLASTKFIIRALKSRGLVQVLAGRAPLYRLGTDFDLDQLDLIQRLSDKLIW